MRISGNIDTSAVTINKLSSSEKVVKQGSDTTIQNVAPTTSNVDETKEKVQEVVGKMNKMLEVHNNSSKFVYHEGLERYYVTVVDRETEEVVKEIPPKRLLDAFYEMQKMLGMIVDKKI